jgi:hypothetical protein
MEKFSGYIASFYRREHEVAEVTQRISNLCVSSQSYVLCGKLTVLILLMQFLFLP